MGFMDRIQMIDRFYAAPLQGEMNIDKLQSKRRARPWEVGQGGRQSAGSDDSIPSSETDGNQSIKPKRPRS